MNKLNDNYRAEGNGIEGFRKASPNTSIVNMEMDKVQVLSYYRENKDIMMFWVIDRDGIEDIKSGYALPEAKIARSCFPADIANELVCKTGLILRYSGNLYIVGRSCLRQLCKASGFSGPACMRKGLARDMMLEEAFKDGRMKLDMVVNHEHGVYKIVSVQGKDEEVMLNSMIDGLLSELTKTETRWQVDATMREMSVQSADGREIRISMPYDGIATAHISKEGEKGRVASGNESVIGILKTL